MQNVWEIPEHLFGNTNDDTGMRLVWGGFKPKENEGGFIMNRFSTNNRNLIVSQKYIEMGFLIESRKLFGFGERQKTFELKTGEYTSWANGRDNHVDNGKLGGHSYGDHPFVLAMLKDKTFLGIFFKNSNAKVLEYSHIGKGQSILNFKAIGGILDFFVFTGETAEEVIKAYHKVIGSPYFPPFWTLGFHQSAWHYNSTKDLDYVLEQYDQNDMPLEAIWLDIEYMDRYRNFEVDKKRFPNLLVTSQSLHRKNQRLITIIDAGLAADETYSAYKEAKGNGYLIMSNSTGEPLIGDVWPGKAAFPDFFNPKTNDYWVKYLQYLYGQATMDGIWLDMNEATIFCQGECPNTEILSNLKDNTTLPYNPTGDEQYTIQNMSLSLDGQHYYTTPEEKELNIEYNMHSLYGMMQAKATYQLWQDKTTISKQRPFILSRSTFAGSGKYTSHWLGDNWSQWDYLRYSISGIMDFNMFGIPLVGADVCGFHGNYEDEMCGRWMQLSAFYPFARNHYNLTDNGGAYLKPQEPYNLKEPYKSAARLAILQRFSFLRYYYTLLFEVSKNKIGTMVRPMFFEFPEDDQTLEDYEQTFMVGSALKVTPVLTLAQSQKGQVSSYFPKGSRWISLNDFKTIRQGSEKEGVTVEEKATWNYTVVHMKEGTIIPYQDSLEKKFARTYDLINDDGLDILIFPDRNGYAEGTLYIDSDGNSQSEYESNEFEYYKLRFSQRTLTIDLLDGTASAGDLTKGNHIIQNIYILGLGNFDMKNATA